MTNNQKDNAPVTRIIKTVALPDVVQFHRPSSDKLTPQLLLKLIRDGVQELFGDYGSGMIAASLKVNYLSTATSTAIVRVSRSHYRLVWAALSFATHLPKPVGEECVFTIVRVSGTIRKAEQEAIRRARAIVLKANSAAQEGQGDSNFPDISAAEDVMSIEDNESDEEEDGEE